MQGRRICLGCKQIYHRIYYPEHHAGICDDCGGKLVARPDDSVIVLEARYHVFMNTMGPVLGYLKDRVITLNGSQSPSRIFEAVLKHLGWDTKRPLTEAHK